MKGRDKHPPELPAAGAFHNLFASKPADSSPAGEPCSKLSLRQKAEAHFREKEELSSGKPDSLSPETLRTILHELRVHQIELEIQNEELRQTQADLVASQARYFDLYALAPVGYITASEAGMVLEANLTAATLLGVDRGALVKQPVTRFILKEDQDIYYKLRQQLVETGDPQQCDLRVLKPDGTTFWAQLNGNAAQDEKGAPVCRVVLSDITWRKQAEEALHESEKQFRAMFELASIGMAQADPRTGQWLRLNQKMCEITGYSVDEMLRMHISELTHPEDRQKDAEAFQGVVKGEAPNYRMEKRYLRKDGAVAWVNVNMTVLRDAVGQPTRTMATIEDITERKRAEAELQNLRAAVEQSANTIVITDLSGNIEYANPAFEKTTGYTLAEAVGQNPRVLKSGGQDAGFYRNLWATITSGKTWRGEFHNRRKDGSLYWESATISPVQDDKGELLHFLAIKEDITQRKALEARLGAALVTAEAGNRAKSEFLGIMSHELRTPLNGVLGSSELLTYTPLDREQESLVGTVSKCGEHLLEIVKDILDFSSMETGKLAIEVAPMAVAEVVEQSALIVQTSAADKRLEFRCETSRDVPHQIVGDALRIRQILINLLGNAVKFTSSGSVVLRVAPDAESRFLDFSVEDTGIGISSETIRHLFKPFTQVDMTSTRAFGGTGIGLVISKRLAEAMGGSVTVVSTPGKGSTFTFHLPLEISDGGMAAVPSLIFMGADGASPSSPSAEQPKPPAGALALVVEDDPENSTTAGKMLQSLGYRAEFAADGAEAVEAFVPGKYFAILMDVVMPVMDGLDATKKIREIEAKSGSHVPIIALTANVMPGGSEQCLAAGMDDFLTKPFKRAELAAKLACR